MCHAVKQSLKLAAKFSAVCRLPISIRCSKLQQTFVSEFIQ
jgi:hypothetical protein